MPSKTNKLLTEFIEHSKKLESVRIKIEDLFSKGKLSTFDAEQVYAGLFLDIFTELESKIEQLFIGLLNGKFYSSSSSIKRMVKMTPVDKTKDVLFGDKIYLAWLPYPAMTIPRARRYLFDGKPFTLLDQPQKDNLNNYHIIRNAITHKSDFSKSKFLQLINHLTLLPSEKTPTGYLRSKPSGHSGQTQYEISVYELENIIKVFI